MGKLEDVQRKRRAAIERRTAELLRQNRELLERLQRLQEGPSEPSARRTGSSASPRTEATRGTADRAVGPQQRATNERTGETATGQLSMEEIEEFLRVKTQAEQQQYPTALFAVGGRIVDARGAWERMMEEDRERAHPIIMREENGRTIFEGRRTREILAGDVFGADASIDDYERRVFLQQRRPSHDIARAMRDVADEVTASSERAPSALLAGQLAGILREVAKALDDLANLPNVPGDLLVAGQAVIDTLSSPEFYEALAEDPVGAAWKIGRFGFLEAPGLLLDAPGIGEQLGEGAANLAHGRFASAQANLTRAGVKIINAVLLVRLLIAGIRRAPAVVRRMAERLRSLRPGFGGAADDVVRAAFDDLGRVSQSPRPETPPAPTATQAGITDADRGLAGSAAAPDDVSWPQQLEAGGSDPGVSGGRPRRTPPAALSDGTPLHGGLRRSYNALQRMGIDVTDDYTLAYLNRMFGRFRSDDLGLIARRADAGELRAMMRYARQPDVERVRFLRPGMEKGDRTPDLEVWRRGASTPEHVEVRTLTQVRRGSGPSSRDRVVLWLGEQDIERKIFRGQISASRPGTIVFHAPMHTPNQHWAPVWQATIDSIRARRPLPTGLRRIEVTTGGGRLLVFEPPDWIGRTVR